MPFTTITLNDGLKIPEIAFGTWKVPTNVCTQYTDTAISVGFDHVDTAQVYGNEKETGFAINDSGLSRDEIWVTTKWSGVGGKGIRESCLESLEKLGLKYLDLYLIHSPRLVVGNIAGAWKEMEMLKKEGLVKSIGVSNFTIPDLLILLATAEIKPVVNQILIHPYVYAKTAPLLAFMEKENIKPEAYSALYPLTSAPGGPVDPVVNAIANKKGVAAEQILLAWVRTKGAIIITTSSKKDRLERYLAVGDIELDEKDVEAIDKAGAKGAFRSKAVRAAKWTAAVGVVGAFALWRML